MEKLKMHTANKVDENISKIAELFPNVITETVENGVLKRAVDFDLLKQELEESIVEGFQERYQFTWPDKKKSVVLANTPISKTLRLNKSKSIGRDGTSGSVDSDNIYIEGDNLDALKLLQETYIGKVKMIYIDPPYNTGNDFVYNDNFTQNLNEYSENSGQYDDQKNQLVQNPESNGRFHTDWLNMIYPRLRLSKDLLTTDGVIFISIDDNEQCNLKKICDEIFGAQNFVAIFPWRKRTAKSDVPFGISQDYEWILCYAKSSAFIGSIEGNQRKYYETEDFPGKPWRIHDMSTQRTAQERPNSDFTIINPKTGEEYPVNPNAVWRITKEGFPEYMQQHRIVFPGDYDFLKISKPVLRYWKSDDIEKAGDSFGRISVTTKLPDDIGMSQDGTKEIQELLMSKVFSYPKPSSLIKRLLSFSTKQDSLVLDFFSGSATTAHAVMQLNSEDGGHRRFILVQLPEKTDSASSAKQNGFLNICDIGEERIRRAGRVIKESNPLTTQELDIGFRCFSVDSSNMKDVYYKPSETKQVSLDDFIDNIKEDRTSEDLLVQIMLELGILLSSKIEEIELNGKTVYSVADGYLCACFENDIDDALVKDIAKRTPYYAVFRDSGYANDSVATNFEQIFETYSPNTIRKVL